jgi:hypothetical protein
VTLVSSVVLLAAGPQALIARAAESTPGPQGERARPEAFGFSVGEERRYAMARDDVLEPGEIESWTVSLEGMEPAPEGGFTAYFLLEHESKRFARRGNIFNPDEMFTAVATTRLWVNQYGFPLRLDYSYEHSNYAVTDERYRVLFENDRFVVTGDAAMTIQRLELEVPDVSHVDLSVPRGIFLSIHWHPALLSLPYAVLADGRKDVIEYVSFTPPSAAQRHPRARGGRPFRVAAIGVGNPGRTTVTGVTMSGDRVRVGGNQDWWVGDDGAVQWAASPNGFWIRLLRPSEY